MDLDEDSHLCIRCNKTIIGLQNYVNHRQSNCGAQVAKSLKTFSPNYHFLDSHSSSKKMQSYEAFNFGDERDDDEEEESLDEGDEEEEEEEEEEDVEISEQNNKSAESEFKEYDYDFFSSLELQYLSKRDEIPQARRKKFHQRILTRKATAAITATQNDDEWIDDSNAGINKKEEDFKYYHNESTDSDDSEPAVPRNYARGKWKPGTRIVNNYGEKWKSDVEDTVAFHENESSNEDNLEKSLEIDDTQHPPSTHTKGKWIPGSKSGVSFKRLEFKEEKTDEKNDSFWCKVCNRTLATRAIFERHLKTNLHKKRTKNEKELEGAGESLPLRNINELSAHFEQTLKEKSAVTGENTEIIEIESEILNRATTSTPITRKKQHAHDDVDFDDYNQDDDGNIYCAFKSKGSDEKMEKKKFRSRTKITCEECDIKLPVHLFGKHLISHFHYRKMLQNPNTFDSVLNNFHKIVIHLPFQCKPCKFYFNTREQFTRHWNSIEHAETVSKLVGGKFLCSFCKFECEADGEMTAHLEHSEHQQVVTLINRSKPIVVRYISLILCKFCRKEFRYNIQLLQHLKTCEYKSEEKFIFDGFTCICNICDKTFQSALALQKHKVRIHKISIFYCSECNMTFNSAVEAKKHRRTNLHKAISLRKRTRKISNDVETTKCLKKKMCPYCKQEQLDVIELKQHISTFHPKNKFSCGLCGLKFTLPQDVSQHVRNKLCKFYNTNRTAEQSTTTCTLTSNEAVDLENADVSTSPTIAKTFPLITSESIKYPSATNDKVSDSPIQDLDILDNNFSDILLTNTFQMSTNNVADEDVDKEFETVIAEIDNNEKQVVEILFSCSMCQFSTGSHAEFIFHEILHQVPHDQKSTVKLQCSICKKFFRKQSLREHLRQHTQERIFHCTTEACPMSFTRKANLKNHITNVHNKVPGELQSSALFLCRICGKKFASKFILEQHKFIHRQKIETKTLPCQISDCTYIEQNSIMAQSHLLESNVVKLNACSHLNCDFHGETPEQLKIHFRKHQEPEFRFYCEHCDYKTKLSSHLKRHMRIHEANRGRIYKCNFCQYACNNSENLRKHVLHSAKHQGRFMYECIYCDDEDENTQFKCNYLKEYQQHLKSAHNISKKIP